MRQGGVKGLWEMLKGGDEMQNGDPVALKITRRGINGGGGAKGQRRCISVRRDSLKGGVGTLKDYRTALEGDEEALNNNRSMLAGDG